MSQYASTYNVGGILLGFEDYTTDLKHFKGLEERKVEWVHIKGIGTTANIAREKFIKVDNTGFLKQNIKRGDEYLTSFISGKKERGESQAVFNTNLRIRKGDQFFIYAKR